MYDALHKFITECGIHILLSAHEHMQRHVQMDGVDYLIQGAASSIGGRAKPLQHESALSLFMAVRSKNSTTRSYLWRAADSVARRWTSASIEFQNQ